jgi:hypothetical protein
MCSSEDLITKVMYKAYALGVQEDVFDKVTELSGSIKIYDTYTRAQVYEQALKLVTNGNTNPSTNNSPA